MSGGYFDHREGILRDIIDKLDGLIINKEVIYEECRDEAFIEHLIFLSRALQVSFSRLKHADYLLSGDYGIDSWKENKDSDRWLEHKTFSDYLQYLESAPKWEDEE